MQHPRLVAEALAAFPRRPVAVRVHWRARLALAGSALVALGLLVGVGLLGALYGPGLLSDSLGGLTGESARVLEVRGGCRAWLAWLPVAQCDYDVRHLCPGAGAAETARLTALTLLGVDSSAPPEARVRPDGSLALNWLVDAVAARWTALLAAAAAAAALAAVLAVATRRGLADHRLWRSLARAPKPVAATLLSSELEGSPNWAIRVRFAHPTGEATQRLAVVEGSHKEPPARWRYQEPLALSPDGRVALALAGPEGARLLTTDLGPLLLSDEERARLLDAAARAARGASR